jgi:hypothetical protein
LLLLQPFAACWLKLLIWLSHQQQTMPHLHQQQQQRKQQTEYDIIDRVLALDSSLKQLPNDLALRPDPHLLMSYTPLLQHPMPMGYEVQLVLHKLNTFELCFMNDSVHVLWRILFVCTQRFAAELELKRVSVLDPKVSLLQ